MRYLYINCCWLLTILSWLYLTACSSGPNLNPLEHDARILAFGDSLTVGVGAEKDSSYTAVLSELTSLEVFNAGISGETTDKGLPRFTKLINEQSFDVVILLEGGNDILKNKDLAKTKHNLLQMISVAKNKGIQVILLGVPEKRLFSGAAPFYDELAREQQVVYDGELIPDLLHSPGYKADPIHLNSDGYRAMAEALHKLIVDRGGLVGH